MNKNCPACDTEGSKAMGTPEGVNVVYSCDETHCMVMSYRVVE